MCDPSCSCTREADARLAYPVLHPDIFVFDPEAHLAPRLRAALAHTDSSPGTRDAAHHEASTSSNCSMDSSLGTRDAAHHEASTGSNRSSTTTTSTRSSTSTSSSSSSTSSTRASSSSTKVSEEERKDTGGDTEFVSQDVCTPRSGEEALRELFMDIHDGVYVFECFTQEFCMKLLEEIENFEAWSKKSGVHLYRPNSMNNYGVILEHIGMSGFCDAFMRHVGERVGRLLYPAESGARDLDGHHAFIVEYQMSGDLKLNFHVDDSELTFNVCLGKEFVGGELEFLGKRCDVHVQTQPLKDEPVGVRHMVGYGMVHLGKHRHLARAIRSGHRLNFILWCKSSTYRSRARREGECPSWCGFHSIASSNDGKS